MFCDGECANLCWRHARGESSLSGTPVFFACAVNGEATNGPSREGEYFAFGTRLTPFYGRVTEVWKFRGAGSCEMAFGRWPDRPDYDYSNTPLGEESWRAEIRVAGESSRVPSSSGARCGGASLIQGMGVYARGLAPPGNPVKGVPFPGFPAPWGPFRATPRGCFRYGGSRLRWLGYPSFRGYCEGFATRGCPGASRKKRPLARPGHPGNPRLKGFRSPGFPAPWSALNGTRRYGWVCPR